MDTVEAFADGASDGAPAWQRAAARLARCAPTPTATPFSMAMAMALIVVFALVRLDVVDRDGAAAWTSTNLENLVAHPLESLLASAFVVTGGFGPQLVLVVVAFTALERSVGTKRTALLTWAGHVTATLLTEIGLALGIHAGFFALSASNRIDVGISYAMFTALGAFAILLPARGRPGAAIALAVLTGVPLILDADLTAVGHVVAVLFGATAMRTTARRQRLHARACVPYVANRHAAEARP